MPAVKKSKIKIQKSDNQKSRSSKKVVRKSQTTSSASQLTVDVVDIKGKKKGTVTLPRKLFGVKMNTMLIAQAVRVYLANQRQGGAKTKTRGDVTGSGRKIYRQKGTGRARHGDKYAGIFVGGGKAHGPKQRSFSLQISQKMKKGALACVLSKALQDGRIVIIDGMEKIDNKTKTLMEVLQMTAKNTKNGHLVEKTLIATNGKSESIYRAGSNIAQLTIREAQLLHTYEVMNNKRIIFTKEAVESIGGKMK